ncbi:MAG TPA: universal stress protein [Ktedonobacterales bacterium]|jgi:nucleotide-binding universal stress UspA family protein|nr:universal stress protein [Ktedonobacterales bacterium]
MLRHILIPLDGSELAERAIPVAAQIAKATEGSAISLVRIVRAPAEFETSATDTAVWAPAADEDEKREANNYLHEVAQRPELAGLSVTERIYAGPPSATLVMAAKSLGVDLIVMTSRGRSGITRWLLGSVAEGVSRESSAPTLIVRAEKAEDESTLGGAALVPVDGSPLAEAAIEPAARLAAALAGDKKASLYLLYIVQPLPMTATAPLGYGVQGAHMASLNTELDLVKEGETYLQDLAKRAGAEYAGALGVTITYTSLYGADIAGDILAAAEGTLEAAPASQSMPSRADFIAMATHGRGGLRRWVMGSVTDRVLHATTRPLLVVRPVLPDTRDTVPPADGQ